MTVLIFNALRCIVFINRLIYNQSCQIYSLQNVPGIKLMPHPFFVVSVIIVLSVMKIYVQKLMLHWHCRGLKKYWTPRDIGLNLKLKNSKAQNSISSRRFTDPVAVQYLEDLGHWDNLEESLAYCAEATLVKLTFVVVFFFQYWSSDWTL